MEQTKYDLIQYRDTEFQKDSGYILERGKRYKEIRGLIKSQFHSHMEMLMKHEFHGWDDWEVDESNFILRAREGDRIVYEYRLEIVGDFIGAPNCSVCGAEVPYF